MISVSLVLSLLVYVLFCVVSRYLRCPPSPRYAALLAVVPGISGYPLLSSLSDSPPWTSPHSAPAFLFCIAIYHFQAVCALSSQPYVHTAPFCRSPYLVVRLVPFLTA